MNIKCNSGIYCIGSDNDARVYIGSTNNLRRRWKEHIEDLSNRQHGNPKLQKFADKYGANVLHFSVIEYCAIPVLLQKEEYWISAYDAVQAGFNCDATPTRGGRLGRPHSETSKEKMSASIKARWARDPAKYAAMFRKHGATYLCTPAAQRKSQATLATKDWTGSNNPFFGKTHSYEAKQKMRKIKQGLYIGKDNPNYGKRWSAALRERVGTLRANAAYVIGKCYMIRELSTNQQLIVENMAEFCRSRNLSYTNFVYKLKHQSQYKGFSLLQPPSKTRKIKKS